jgi:hypothetical protein
MLTRREFLAAGTAAALAASPNGSFAQVQRRPQTGREAVPPTSPSPVSTRPPDNLGGATVNVGSNPGDLQTAINAALHADGTHRGNTYVCPAGVTYNSLMLPAATGTGWTCIRSGSASLPPAGTRVQPSHAATMFRIQSSGAINDARCITMPSPTSGWRFIGMELANPNDNFTYAMVEVVKSNRISFERCCMHARPGQFMRRALYFLFSDDLQVWDSYISECKEGPPTDSDTQTIFTRGGSRIHIENCELQAAGENIMFGDQGSSLPTNDITFRRNHCYKPLAWRGVIKNVKNLFEIKFAWRILAEGNTFENNWLGAQPGDAIILNNGLGQAGSYCDTRDLMFRHNTVINSPAFLVIADLNNGDGGPIRCAFLNNLGLQIPNRGLKFLHRCNDIWIEHNTIVQVDASSGDSPFAAVLLAPDAPGKMPNFTFKHNIIGGSTYGMFCNGRSDTATYDRWLPDRTFQTNAIVSLSGQPALTSVQYLASPSVAGIDVVTGRLNPRSPLIRAGSDGKDLGVDFVQLTTAQTGK